MSVEDLSSSTLATKEDSNAQDAQTDMEVGHAAPVSSKAPKIATTASAPKLSFWQRYFAIKPPVIGDPRENLSRIRKGVILAIIAQAGCLGGFSSTIYFPSLVQISKDLNASQTAINASVSLFILAMGIAPVFWATLSEAYKIRRVLYFVSVAIFLGASIGGGFATTAGALIAARCFQAVGSSGSSILGAATVADIYIPTEQGTSMGLMFLGQFLGPVLGPPVGGALAQAFGWQWTFFFMAILSAIILIEIFFWLPETYRVEPKDTIEEMDEKEQQVISEPEEEKKNKWPNPFTAIFLLRHPVIFLTSLETGIIFALMFSIETISPVLFDEKYHLNESQTGATYIAAGVGSVVGAVLGGKLSDMALARGKNKRGGELVLEDRLSPNIWLAAFILVPFGSLLYGWSAEKNMSIAAPIAGFGIYNFGMSQVLSAGSAYLVNAIPGQGSTATAAANFLRMVMACVFSLVVKAVVDKTGYGWYGVILAGLNIVCMALFALVKFKGAAWRADAIRKMSS
ncbi:hypothetical protein BGW41_005383 [Actinomortierella wolfii]|nr:hypothetical protein BGW41_005383 [Actinomortierella wolfii]